MSNQVQTVKFYDDVLITIEQDNIQYVAVRPIVENMGLDKVGFLFYSIWQGVSKPSILHSVIATPSDFLLPITFCYGQDGAYRENAQPTVYGVLNILSTLFQTRVKSQYTGVLANV
ncbi:phage antirepressor N-terminal domain-containing protein [Moraxella haemolytica]|uniref:phage antirepressor N-terminal domain-containing protein n=1 Tax=Moraxella haemolytica TaxID=2904119 RepID=UPI0025436D23|nr:phage antirepressor N-terminal domain-containing protein [Moraxella sp. ZY171148]WII94990.1 phage antirepressor N-terminal domain-containing protein [Moraxella sp. ZY171148]